jgi:hypothetical protein
MPVKDEEPDRRGDACEEDWPDVGSGWWMAPGEKWEMHLSVDFHRTVAPGDYNFDVVVGVVGGKSDPQQPAPRKFDFNMTFPAPTGDTPTMAGYIGVKRTDIFDTTKGYGWDASICCTWASTGGPAQMVDLLRDAHLGATGHTGSRVFSVKVEPNAPYKVLLHFWTGSTVRDQIDVFNADAAQEGVVGIALMANTHVQKEFSIGSSGQDGIVRIKIRNSGGNDDQWILNGLEVTRQ